jgi:hypothetical protein
VKVIGNLTKDAIIRAAVSEGLTVTQVIGTPVVFEAAQANYESIAYDVNAQKVVVVYVDAGNSSYGTAIVGTVDASNNSISFGSPVVFESAATNYTRVEYDANAQKVVIVYRDDGNSNYGTAIVGTVSGTSISFGTPAVFNSANTVVWDIVYESNAQKVVITHRTQTSPYEGKAIVGTVSGTSISFGSATQYNTGSTSVTRLAYDANAQKVVLAWEDGGNNAYGTAIVGTVSGTGISFGSEVVFNAATSSECGIAYDSDSQKIVIGYRDQGDSNIGKAIVGTVSGTSISFGTATAFGTGNDEYIALVYDTNAQKIVVAYSDTTTDGKLNVGTVSGTSISFGTEAQFESGRANYVDVAYDSVQKRVVIVYQDAGNSSHGTAVVTKTGYTSATGGTIADGKPVIVNANGTVSSVGQSTISEAKGSAVVFENSGTGECHAVYDSSNQKVVVSYRDTGDSNKGTAVVGTVNASDNSITFGTPVVFTSKNIEWSQCTYDSTNNKVVIAYANAASPRYGHAIVGTVSGTSISFGSEATFNTYEVQHVGIGFDEGTGKVVIAYEDWGNSNYGMAIVGTVSGTSITFGTEVTYESARTQKPSVVYDSNAGKTVICFTTYGDSEHGYAIVGTVSGTSISFGSKTEFENAVISEIHAVYDSSAQKIVIAYEDHGNSYYGTAVVGTVSSSSISFGTPVVFESANVGGIGIAYDSNVGKVVISYSDQGNSNYGTVVSGTVSGTSISFDTPFVFESASSSGTGAAYDANAKKVVIAYTDGGNSSHGTGIVYQPSGSATTLTTENFVGFMDGAALDGTNGEILSSCSIARNQTSLTPGQTYFVSPTDGALSTTAGSPSVTAGTAISSTEIIVKG